MSPDFDKAFWEDHWRPGDGPASMGASPPNPYLAQELGDLRPGTALDAGCGGGAEALWLADRGWQVTAADISAEALRLASARAEAAGVHGIRWVEADLGTWAPGSSYDLVTTHYAHPSIPQLDLYERLAGWVAPGGTLLVVGHGGGGRTHGHGHGHEQHGHPEEAVVTADAVARRLAGLGMRVVTAQETSRTTAARTLHDVVVRATRETGKSSG